MESYELLERAKAMIEGKRQKWRRDRMLTYHGNPDLKCALVYRAEKHAEFDRLRQDFGYFREWSSPGDWKGCAIGCLSMPAPEAITKTIIEEAGGGLRYAGIVFGLDKNDCVRILKGDFGLSADLVLIAESIFEELPEDKAKTWPLEFAKAIPVGVGVSPARLWGDFSRESATTVERRRQVLLDYLESLAPNQEQPVCTPEAERIAVGA